MAGDEFQLHGKYAGGCLSEFLSPYALQAFKDIVETKEAVAGKQATPSASADNVAMLQLSGTLANR